MVCFSDVFGSQERYPFNSGKVAFSRLTQGLVSVSDICLCQLVWGSTWQLFGPQQHVELINAVTGRDPKRGCPQPATLEKLDLGRINDLGHSSR